MQRIPNMAADDTGGGFFDKFELEQRLGACFHCFCSVVVPMCWTKHPHAQRFGFPFLSLTLSHSERCPRRWWMGRLLEILVATCAARVVRPKLGLTSSRSVHMVQVGAPAPKYDEHVVTRTASWWP